MPRHVLQLLLLKLQQTPTASKSMFVVHQFWWGRCIVNRDKMCDDDVLIIHRTDGKNPRIVIDGEDKKLSYTLRNRASAMHLFVAQLLSIAIITYTPTTGTYVQ